MKKRPKRTSPIPAGLQRTTSTSNKAKKVVGKPWVKGQSGNPSGKRAGTVSPTAALKRALTRRDAELIARKVIALAKKGDATILRVLLDRLDGPLSGPLAQIAVQSVFQTPATPPAERVQILITDNHRNDPALQSPISKEPVAAETVIEVETELEEPEAEPVSRVMTASDFLNS